MCVCVCLCACVCVCVRPGASAQKNLERTGVFRVQTKHYIGILLGFNLNVLQNIFNISYFFFN